MILDVINDKENYQKHLHEYQRLIQRKRRIWEVAQQFLQTQEKAYACAKFWGNLKGKRCRVIIRLRGEKRRDHRGLEPKSR